MKAIVSCKIWVKGTCQVFTPSLSDHFVFLEIVVDYTLLVTLSVFVCPCKVPVKLQRWNWNAWMPHINHFFWIIGKEKQLVFNTYHLKHTSQGKITGWQINSYQTHWRLPIFLVPKSNLPCIAWTTGLCSVRVVIVLSYRNRNISGSLTGFCPSSVWQTRHLSRPGCFYFNCCFSLLSLQLKRLSAAVGFGGGRSLLLEEGSLPRELLERPQSCVIDVMTGSSQAPVPSTSTEWAKSVKNIVQRSPQQCISVTLLMFSV